MVGGRGGVYLIACWDTPPLGRPPGRHPSLRWPLQQMVSILLECILVPYELSLYEWNFSLIVLVFFRHIIIGKPFQISIVVCILQMLS